MPFPQGIRMRPAPLSGPAIHRNNRPIHNWTRIACALFCLLTGVLQAANAGAQLKMGAGTPERCGGGMPNSPGPLTRSRLGARNVQNTLPAGDHHDTDLEIQGVACVVPQGEYAYRNVNIWGGGSLTFEDAAIDFHAHSILVENGGTLEAGATGAVTGPITIWLYGSKTDSVAPITCKSGATCGVPTAVWDSNPNVVMSQMPAMGTNCTTVNQADSSYPANTYPGNDCFYQYEQLTTGDPANAYFGRKV